MSPLDKMKIMLGINDTEKDALLTMIIDTAKDYIESYCNTVYDASYDNIVVQMALEDYSKIGSQGLSSQSAGGASESYLSDYSTKITKLLNKYKKIRTI